jgi:alpha/beta superfamily hydrolase
VRGRVPLAERLRHAAAMFTGRVLIPAPHGQLEAIYRPPAQPAARVALVLHPHPLFGGTMHNKVVFQTAKALEADGVVTLRINFRGVGGSSGTHDGGRGEADDASLGLDYLLAQQPEARDVLLAGFSFGAAVGLRVGCADARVHRLLAIGTPARWLTAAALAACAKPIRFVHGRADDVAPLEPLETLLAAAQRESPTELRVVDGAGHFFAGQLDALRAAVVGA